MSVCTLDLKWEAHSPSFVPVQDKHCSFVLISEHTGISYQHAIDADLE